MMNDETQALCVLVDKATQKTKWVKPKNLVVAFIVEDGDKKPVTLGDIIDIANKNANDIIKLKKAVEGLSEAVNLQTANIELLKGEVM